MKNTFLIGLFLFALIFAPMKAMARPGEIIGIGIGTCGVKRRDKLIRELLDNPKMPSRIPLTATGNFDSGKVHEIANLFWMKNGTHIQKYASDIKQGTLEETAFNTLV